MNKTTYIDSFNLYVMSHINEKIYLLLRNCINSFVQVLILFWSITLDFYLQDPNMIFGLLNNKENGFY